MTSLIRSLALRNFKGFSDEVRIELRPITLLFGANSAGKSSVLQALQYVREILERHRPQGVDIEAVLAIIDGHDTTRHAKSLEDAVVKDADKVWRTTPHGMSVIRGWYGWSVAEYIDMVSVVSNPRLLTAPGRAMATVFTAALQAEQDLLQYLEQT